MLDRSPKVSNAVAYHEAAYIVTARVLGVPLRPTAARLVTVNRHGCDVVDIGARAIYDLDAVTADADMLDNAAIVMFARRAPTHRC